MVRCEREFYDKESQREVTCGKSAHPGLSWCLACVNLVAQKTHEASVQREETGECWCATCAGEKQDAAIEAGMERLEAIMLFQRMHLCPVCRNKRCPLAEHHHNSCGHSNRIGQWGSSWEQAEPPSGGYTLPPPLHDP